MLCALIHRDTINNAYRRLTSLSIFRPPTASVQLAAVLAHELGHAVAKHAHEKISTSLISGALLTLLAVIGVPVDFLPVAQLLAPDVLRFDLHHSRTMESEADTIGLHLMAKSCIAPEAAPRVFELLSGHMSRLGIPEHSRERTHPTNPERIAALRAQIPTIRAECMRHCAHEAAPLPPGRRPRW